MAVTSALELAQWTGFLSDPSCTWTLAQSDEEALFFLKKEVFDLVLFGGSDPQALLEATLRLGKAQGPVIFLLDEVDDLALGRAFEGGAADLMVRPLNVAEFKARIKVQLKLRRVQAELAQSVRSQKELLTVLSHDLQNPLGSVALFLNLVEESPELLPEFLPNLKDSVNAGLQVIDMVRQLRNFGDHPLELAPVSVDRTINQVVNNMKNHLRQKKVGLVFELEPGLKVLAEPVSLANSVLANLISNGIKFSMRGSPLVVGAKLEGDWVCFDVRDQGIGIPQLMMSQLFDLTRNVHRLGTEGEEGTGYGLILLKKFLDFYGGRIQFQSSEQGPNRGTCVKIFLKNLKQNKSALLKG